MPVLKAFDTGEEHLNLVYYRGEDADSDRHKLHLFVPPSEKPVPLLLWFPQGAWAFGSRDQEADVARSLTQYGIAVAAVDHRMSSARWAGRPREDGAVHPDHILDAVRAVLWAREDADDYGVDTNRIFVGGYSSGAHLAALMVTNHRFLREVGLEVSEIRGVIPVGGAYAMERYYDALVSAMGQDRADSHVFEVFGPESESLWDDISPSAHLSTLETPMLVISETDTYEYTSWFEEDVEKAGRSDLVWFHHVRDRGHADLWRDLGSGEARKLMQRIVDWMAIQ